MRYEFTFGKGRVVFDWSRRTIFFESEGKRKGFNAINGEYPFEEGPLFTNFFVAGICALCRLSDIHAKMVLSREGFVLEFYQTKKVEQGKVGFLLATDNRKKASSAFMFNKPNLYAFLLMLKERDKIVPVQDSVWEKQEGRTFVNKIEIPFQKAKALEWSLWQKLYSPISFSFTYEWENGRIHVLKRTLIVEKKRKEKFITLTEIDISNEINIARILSCL